MTATIYAQAATTVHVIGKCPTKGCKNRRRNTLPGIVVTDRFGTHTEYKIPSPDDDLYRDGVRPTPVIGSRPSSHIYTEYRHERAVLAGLRALGWVCDEHDQFMKLIAVKGVVNIDKTCNERCLSATGPNCECACGGGLHGAAYG